MTRECKKCKSPMHKSKTILSGNSKYEFYSCEGCGYEEQTCVGVINK